MVRTQIQLSEDQYRKLRRLAQERGVSMAELVRRSVDGLLEAEAVDRDELYERVSRLVGRYEDIEGAEDLADEHDRYLDQTHG